MSLRFIKNTIYHLEKEYGQRAVYHRVQVGKTDFTTGKQNKSIETFNIKPVHLPDRLYQDFANSIFRPQLLSSSTSSGETRFLLSGKKVIPKKGDFLVVRSIRWNINEIMDVEGVAFILVCNGVEGATTDE